MRKNKLIYLMLIPGVLVLTLFLIIPILITISQTFKGSDGITAHTYIKLFTNKHFISVYIRTIKLASITTIIAIILGFPTAYYISTTNKKVRGLYIMFAVFPLLTSAVVRSFSWMVILGKKGLLNTMLMKLSIIDKPLKLLYNEVSIVIGLVYLFLPLMIMSLVGVMENISSDLTEAAESLGASKLKAFLKVILPLSIPGLIVGSVLVFTGSLTAYTTPQLLGGSKSMVLSTLIKQKTSTLNNWTEASAIATIMIVTTLIVGSLIKNMAKKLNKAG
ncbi:ABC transporter permease [Clostridiaceae bacterium M8S5]|nr:ABC transporter permease [Clostridiaceae bacterium M8S5]